jgi:signal transduction histidine kinase
MARLGTAVPVKTLAGHQGLAGLRLARLGYTVRRSALAALAIGALIAGLSATSVALEGVADAGVTTDQADTIVLDVSPTGFAWRAGIRPGDTVVSTAGSDEPDGWRMDTRDAAGNVHIARAALADAGTSASLPVGVVALLLGALAVLFLSTRRRWVVPTSTLALLAAGVPLVAHGGSDLSTAVLAGAAIVPAVNLGRRFPIPIGVRGGILVAFLVFIVVWAAARLSGSDSYADLEAARNAVAFWGALALLADRAVVPILRGESIVVMRPRLFDVAVIAAFAALGLVLMNVVHIPPLVAGALLLAVMAFLPSSRRRFGEPLEDALFGDVREAAAAEAAEAERARLARELHDVPLQELVAVIRRLEIKPGTEAESEDLRALAGHLRNVATELRPPVLDDLGLPAALDYLAEESTTNALPVTAVIADTTGFGSDRRPPSDVELAMYRIASEAVGNAVRHSGGSLVSITGSVAPDRVDVVISDDGAGLAAERARDAAKHKRMGLASMRRRAQAIDAELSIDGAAGGTRVRVAWQA